jgi:RNA polymerase sigma-70 factor (ECF subfamily)
VGHPERRKVENMTLGARCGASGIIGVVPTTEQAFLREVAPYRAELLAHCYRMLGSVHDAEDALQDALLRAWRARAQFRGDSSLRGWLYRIATNASLDLIERNRRRVLPVDVEDDADPVWLEPLPDAGLSYELRESVELAFVAALQQLPGTQRAVLILRDVLGFSARETAEMLDTSVDSVNSALRRARRSVQARTPERSQQATLRDLGDDRVRALVGRYVDALERGDVEAIIALLADDATWSMPPYPQWFAGHAEIRAFLLAGPLRQRWRHAAAHANGQVAVCCYRFEDGRFVPAVLDVLTFRGDRIAAVTAFVTPDIERFRAVPGSSGHAEHPQA